MKRLKALFSIIIVLLMTISFLPLTSSAIKAETFTISIDSFGKEVICGQFTFWWSPQNDLDSAIETAVPLNVIKAVKGGDGAFCRRYFTQEELQSGDYSTMPFHTSSVNGQITINSIYNGFNIVCFEAPYNGTYTYKLLAHTWWGDDSNIKVYFNGEWLTDGAVFMDKTDSVEAAKCSVEMKTGEKLYFIFTNSEEEGYDPITFDIFEIKFHGNNEPYPENTSTDSSESESSVPETTVPASSSSDTESATENDKKDEIEQTLIICSIAGAFISATAFAIAHILKKKNK